MATNDNMETILGVKLILPSQEPQASSTPSGTQSDREPDQEYDVLLVDEIEHYTVKLGRQGENDTQNVRIDCSDWLTELPNCQLMIAALRPGEREIYVPEITVSNGVVTWPIMAQDTALAGIGRAEVRALLGEKVKKSVLFKTRILPALDGDAGGVPTTPPNWVKQIIDSVEEAQASVERSEALIEEATACAINAVRFDEAQGLTEEQKATGRGNIDAPADGEVIKWRGVVSADSHARLANVTQEGTYVVTGTMPSDVPAGFAQGTLIVVRSSNGWNMQFLYEYAENTAKGVNAWYRLVNRTSGQALMDWQRITGRSAVSRFYGKKLSIIGDSIDTYNQAGCKIDGYAMYYPSGTVTDVEQTWWKQVLNATGMALEVNASYSGSRVTDTDSSMPDFFQRVSLIGSPDTVFITLGTNDSNNSVALGEYDFDTAYASLSESTFRTAYIKGVKAIQAELPNAQIVCITERMRAAYKESIAHIANTLGCVYIDASDYIAESGNHPGEIGMRQIAAMVLYPTDTTLKQQHMPADAKGLYTAITTKSSITSAVYPDFAHVIDPGIYNQDERAFADNPCPGANGLLIVMRRSENWNFQVYFPTVWDESYTGDRTAYYRIVNRNDYSTLLDWTPFVDLPEIEVDVPEENLIKVAQTCTAEDLTVGVISGTGEVDPSYTQRRCTQTYFKVSKGDMIFLTNDDVWMAICYYDENKSRIGGTEYYSRKPVEASNHTYTNQTTYRPFVVKQDGYVRMHFRRAESSSGIPDLEDVVGSFVIVSQTDPRNAVALEEYAGRSMIQSRKPVRLDGSLIYGQDGTFVKGKLWSFDDGYSSVGNISVIDVESGTATTRTHDLGHANVVDYNPNNDCLMMFGTQNSHPAIVLYKDPEGATDLRKADAACTIIELYNSSGMLNASASVCWGEADCIAYYMTGVYADSSLAIAPTREIYKLLLGMGSNDLSANGGLGTFISGKAADEYNGTAKILKTYTGEIPFRFTKFSTGNLETPQGMEYDGYLYVGWGFSGHNVLKIALNDDSNGYTVVDNYWVDVLNNDGTSAWYEPEMVALNGPYLYTGSRTGTNKLFLRLDR